MELLQGFVDCLDPKSSDFDEAEFEANLLRMQEFAVDFARDNPGLSRLLMQVLEDIREDKERFVGQDISVLLNQMRYETIDREIEAFAAKWFVPFGRLWQSLILQKWKPFFAWMPVETLVHENQDAHYRALEDANNAGESTVFVEFMLGIIRDALAEVISAQSQHVEIDENASKNVVTNVAVNVVSNEERILELLEQDGQLTASVLASTLGLTVRQVQRIEAKLKAEGKLVRHGASKNGWWQVVR